MKKVILIVLDSLGVGALPDSRKFGDDNPHTLQSLYLSHPEIRYPNLEKMGLGNIAEVNEAAEAQTNAYYGKLAEISNGKDTTTGHWEMCGIITVEPLATYPTGFPAEMLAPFVKYLGTDILGNENASGTEIIERLGREHMLTGKPIVYTSADSVLQIAAHEDVIPLDRLYEICANARELYREQPYQVGRIIARPFYGKPGEFIRDNANRRDFALNPPTPNLLTVLQEKEREVLAVGKIDDIFSHVGISKAVHTKDNMDGVDQTLALYQNMQNGLLFTNLVEFDSKYGHRRDVLGYTKALTDFDRRLPEIVAALDEETLLIITADHGCDPAYRGTDHTREYVPFLIYHKQFSSPGALPTGQSLADIGATVADYLEVEYALPGQSFLARLK